MIGIIGYGRFGALMARYLAEDCPVRVWNRSGKGDEIRGAGAQPCSLESVCEADTIILSVPISSMEATLDTVAPLIRPDALIVDVCSVKILPIQWMASILPPDVSILGTHPMFGPDSAADSLKECKIVLCPVRLGKERYKGIYGYLTSKGLEVIETSAEDHDRQIAVSLSLTHFIGRSLEAFGAKDLQIDTEGYQRLMTTLGVVTHDTWQLFEDMHRFNPFAGTVRRRFIAAMNDIDKRL